MMRKFIAAVIASTLAFGVLATQAADLSLDVNWHQDENLMQRSSVQSYMFDGINLTELQRQQMRDLMHRARHDSPSINISEMEIMYSLVTAEDFDEEAVKELTKKMMQDQVTRQVEMAKVRNQMYRLLTLEQQAALKQQHFQYIEKYRSFLERVQSSSLQVVSNDE